MKELNNRKILLGVTGGIAAYKSADLVRRLREAGAQVHVVMTRAAQKFITPLTLQAVSCNPVHTNLFDPNAEAAMGHIELARWADAVVVAPASANFIAQLAHGFANDLLTTLCLATTAPIIIFPAMNQQMWLKQITQENIKLLKTRDGISVCDPGEGSQACGETGFGRMREPSEIIYELENFFIDPLLRGKKIIITAGPTQEAIDPMRYISNHSSGKMGFALAEATVAAGAEVVLISGPVALTPPQGVKYVTIKSTHEMLQAVQNEIKKSDIFIAAAAVSDYRILNPAKQKLKKTPKNLEIVLSPNPDILSTVAHLPKPPFTVGFAAETENVIANAEKKLREKKVDIILANQVGEGLGFGSDENQIIAIWQNGQREFSRMPKNQLAKELIHFIVERYNAKSSAKNS